MARKRKSRMSCAEFRELYPVASELKPEKGAIDGPTQDAWFDHLNHCDDCSDWYMGESVKARGEAEDEGTEASGDNYLLFGGLEEASSGEQVSEREHDARGLPDWAWESMGPAVGIMRPVANSQTPRVKGFVVESWKAVAVASE